MNINIMDEFIVHQYVESNSKAIYQLYIFPRDCLINIYLVINNKLHNYKTNLNYEGSLVEKYELFEYLKDNYKKFVFVNMKTHIIMSDDKYIFKIPLSENDKLKLKRKYKFNFLYFLLIFFVLMMILYNINFELYKTIFYPIFYYLNRIIKLLKRLR